MRFKGFIDEGYGPQGGRGKWIDEDECVDLLKNRCSKALDEFMDNSNTLWRGIIAKGEFYHIDPTTSKRRSQYTDNYYTILLDNDPRWSKYPKRSQALICTTDQYRAGQYSDTGEGFRVFAYDGASYGVCPGDDIWTSFEETLGSTMLGDVNDSLNSITKYYGIKGFSSVKTFKSFVSYLDKMDTELQNTLKNDVAMVGSWPTNLTSYAPLIKNWVRDGSPPFKNWYLKLFDPKINDFLLTKDIGKVFSYGLSSKEVWTNSKAILVEDGALDYNQLF